MDLGSPESPRHSTLQTGNSRGGTRMTIMLADPPRKTTMGVGFEANRGRSGATSATEGEGQGSGTKACARAGEAEPKADTRFSDAKSRATQDKDSRSEARGTQPSFRAGEN